MKHLYLLSLILLSATVIRVDTTLTNSGSALISGVRWTSSITPTDYVFAGSATLVDSSSGFVVPINPATPDSSSTATADTGAVYMNRTFTIPQFNGGFQVILNFKQNATYGGAAQNFPGRGFAFVVHQSGYVVSPPDDTTAENLGFRNLSNAAGFGLKWPFSSGSPTFNWLPSYSFNEPAVFNQTNLVSINETIRTVTIQYETYGVTTPIATAYIDGQLLFQAPVNLTNYLGTANVTANFGVSSSIAEGFRQTHKFVAGPLPTSTAVMDLRFFSGASRLSVGCPRIQNLVVKNVPVSTLAGRGAVATPWTAEHYSTGSTGISTDWVPGDVVYFQGGDATPNPYCVVELRNNSIPINILGLWKCTDTFITGMTTNTFDDSAMAYGTVFGTNSYDGFNGYPHVGGISSWAERVWAANTASTTTYCRLKVPRYCVPTNTMYCVNSETCVNGLCACVPPFGGVNCTGYVVPTISSVAPLSVPMNSSTVLTITGTNFFSTGTPSCVFTGTQTGASYTVSTNVTVVDSNTIQCRLPNFSGSVSELVSVQVDNGYVGSSKSNGYNISMFRAPIVNSVSPTSSQVEKTVNMTIQGDFPLLANMAYSVRINSTVTSPCTRINVTTLNCQYTSSAPGIYPVEVSPNGAQFYYNNLATFTWSVTNSPYCRNYQTGASRPIEFPFVPSTDIQRGGNISFIKNVAFNASIATVFSGSSSVYGNTTIDSDYCCRASSTNQATYCGMKFPITNSKANITITFPKAARVNEVITSWNDPCQNMAAAYDLYYLDSTANYVKIKTTTTNNATCVTVSGDNRPVGICVDYFSNPNTSLGLIDTSKLMITFDVSTDNLPPTSTGAWLYELSVIGAYLADPWAVKSTSSFWNSNPKFTADPNITFTQSFGLSVVTINNGAASSSNVAVQIALFDSYGANITAQYLDVPGGNFNQSLSGSAFSGTQLINSIPIGDYTLRFYSSGLQTAVIPLSVTAGAPYRIRATTSGNSTSMTITADAMVSIVSTVCVEDQLGNVLAPGTTDVDVILSAASLTFSGSVAQSFTGGCNAFQFNVSSPKEGNYTLLFSASHLSTALQGTNLTLVIESGPAAKLVYVGPLNHLYGLPAVADPNDPPTVQLVDAAGNPLSKDRKDLYNGNSVTLSFFPTTARSLLNVTVSFQSALAEWKTLSFEGVPGTVYTVTATMDSDSFSPITFPMTVMNCSSIQDDTVVDGWSCKCKAGYYEDAGQCTPCPSGTYSTDLGSTECTTCPTNQDTYGQTGQTYCVCDEDHIASDQGGCIACPTGAICGNNTVQGNQKGYWNDGKNVFYPCYVGDENSPTNDNLESSYEACPADRSQGRTKCGEGYAGLACLECSDDYGKQSDYCRACPDARINWAIIIFALLVILGMLIFLVIQGRTPKNKESVSAKILLNHIQMMSLLASLGAIWTDPFFTFLKIGGVSTFADTQIVSVDCTVGSSFYGEFIFFMLIPIFTVIISAIVYVVVYIIRAFITPCIFEEEVKRSYVRSTVLSDWILCVAVVTFIFYPAICIKALEIFDCNIDIDDKTYLTVAPGEECLTDRWRGFVVWAVIMLVLFCVGVPLFVLFMLYKYRMHPNVHVQIILRFFYDGFKSNRYYWEVVILARKFLIVLFIIVFRFRPIYQIFGMLFVIQAALLIHIIFHPYTSGRQYKLELMSLLSILITLFISLYLVDKTDRTVLAAGLSAAVMVMHLFVVASFAFFIGRGLLRRMLAEGWLVIVQYWNKYMPKKFQKKEPQFDQVTEMFQQLGKATDYERDQLYAGLENWWKQAPNYKRRRFVSTLEGLSEGTDFARLLKGKRRGRDDNNNNNNNDESDATSESESDHNVELQPLP